MWRSLTRVSGGTRDEMPMGAAMPESRPARPLPGPEMKWSSATANTEIGGTPRSCE